MGATKTIVIEHFPVEKLPDELRGCSVGIRSASEPRRGIECGQMVRVTVEGAERSEVTSRRPLSSYFGAGKGCYSDEEAVSFIRQLRDE